MSNEGFQITGRVTELSATTTERDYTTRMAVVTVDGRYPETYPITFSDKSGQAAEKLNGVSVGDDVSIWFSIRARRPKDRYFINLDGWRVRVDRAAQSSGRGSPPSRDERRPADRGDYDGPPPPDDDDLPSGLR